MLEDFLLKVNNLQDDIDKLTDLVKPEQLNTDIELAEVDLAAVGWGDVSQMKEYNRLLGIRDRYQKILSDYSSLLELAEVAIQEDEVELLSDLEADFGKLSTEIQTLTLEHMFVGEYDHNNVILSIHAGSGGTEAQDWAGMLLRMYLRWANLNKCKTKILDNQDGDGPGLVKSATIEITGTNVYGLLKNEHGVHRLVRVSPFDSQGRRHTSFAAVEVVPEVELDKTIEINPKDLRIDTFHSSGKGGQHVNTTDSAVRIVHLPTGITVSCQNERSQVQNREYAMRVLLSKLTAIKVQQHYDELSQIQGEQKQINWGSQIRSYVFMPYQMVKDHRTNYETGNIKAVMDGNINDFIFKSLSQ